MLYKHTVRIPSETFEKANALLAGPVLSAIPEKYNPQPREEIHVIDMTTQNGARIQIDILSDDLSYRDKIKVTTRGGMEIDVEPQGKLERVMELEVREDTYMLQIVDED